MRRLRETRIKQRVKQDKEINYLVHQMDNARVATNTYFLLKQLDFKKLKAYDVGKEADRLFKESYNL